MSFRFYFGVALRLGILFLPLCGCSLLEKEPEPANPELQALIKKPLAPEKTEQLLSEVGDNWLFGQGMGSTMATVGTVVVFPPYALLVAGNAGLSLAGYKQLWLSDALPEEGKEAWRSAYDSVTEAPGKMSAAMAGEEFRTQEVARKRIIRVLETAQGS